MESKWIIWTFVPTLTWAGWIHAGIRARHTKYFIYAALYGIPFMLAMILSEGNDKSIGQTSKAYDAVMTLQIMVWIGGIIHAQRVKKEVSLRIKYAGQASVSGISSTDEELEQKIANEYGVQAMPRNAQTAGQSVPSQMDAIANTGELSFVEWYTKQFDWFVTQPMPWNFIFQAFMWITYGFIWIPLWYMISDKTRTAIQPKPKNHPLGHQPVQSPQFVHNPSSRTPPKPSPPASAIPSHISVAVPDAIVVDVNNASEQDIAAMPGIGQILAKKAIKIRQTQGGFESIEQFAQCLGLRPHVVEQIRSRLVFGQLPTHTPGVVNKSSGRVVDF
jgi:hypothetical protein